MLNFNPNTATKEFFREMKRFLSVFLALVMCVSLFSGIRVSAADSATQYVYQFRYKEVNDGDSLHKVNVADTYTSYGSTVLNENWRFEKEYLTTTGKSVTDFNGLTVGASRGEEWLALRLRVPTAGTYSLEYFYSTHNSYGTADVYLAPANATESDYFNAVNKLCSVTHTSSSTSVAEAKIEPTKKITATEDNQEFILIFKNTSSGVKTINERRFVLTRLPDPEPQNEYTYQFRYKEVGDDNLYKAKVADTYTAYGNTVLNENWKFENEYVVSDGKSSTDFNGLTVGTSRGEEWLALRLRVPFPGTYSLEYFYSTNNQYGTSDVFLLPGNATENDYFNVTNKLCSVTHTSSSTNVGESSIEPEKMITTTAKNQEFILVFKNTSSGVKTISARRVVLTKVDPSTLTRKFDFQPDGALIAAGYGVPDTYDTYEKTGKNWKYLDMHDDVKTSYASNYKTFRTLFYGLSFSSVKNGHFVKLGLNADFSGTYAVKLNHYLAAGGANMADIYLAPVSAADHTSEKYKLGTANMRASTEGYGAADLAIVNIEEGEYIFTAKVSNRAEGNVSMYLTSLELTPVTVAEASIVANKTMPLNSYQEVSLVTTIDGNEKALSGATWTSTNESVASVRDDCVIRTHSDGDTIIKAAFGDVVATLPLTVTHPNARVEDATTAKVYITATNGVVLEDVVGTVQGSQIDTAVNTSVSAKAPEVTSDGKTFKYWKNLSNGSVYSTNDIISFKVASNISLMAVYADVASGYLVEFANATREIVKSEYLASGDSIVAPPLPSMTGYGKAKEWSKYPETVGKSDVQSVAIYDAPAKVEISVVNGSADKATYDYDELVTVVADAAPAGQVFSHWTRNGQVVSYNSTYSFYAWADATLTANYATSALSNFPAVIIDEVTRTDGESTAYMMELVGFAGKTILERGLLFGASGLDLHGGTLYKATSVLGATQFTAMAPESGASAVRAYVVYMDNGVIRIAYSAEKQV